jgi:hypothetical protein
MNAKDLTSIGGTGFQPVLAQAKVCGYLLPFQSGIPLQNPCRTLLGFYKADG